MKGIKFEFGTQEAPLPFLCPPATISEWEAVRPRWKQVHGIAIAEVRTAAQECGEVDALWTRVPNLPIAVVSADCVPILLYRRDERAIGAIHAGWRGTFARILEAFFRSLPADLNRPEDWAAIIGPCVHACCYEVSEALIEDFVRAFPECSRTEIEPAPRKFDLVATTQAQLAKLSVSVDSVVSDCTFCCRSNTGSGKYFSYRRGDRNSRQYSMIVKTISSF